MPSGVQLRDLIRGVRAEAGHSLSEAHGQSQRETIAYLLGRKQRTLWYAHDWPMYSHFWDQTFAIGDRYINYPDLIDPNRVNQVAHRFDGRWVKLTHGIGLDHLTEFDSDSDERSTPLRRWQHFFMPGMQQNQLGQVELWPIPSEAGTVRFFGHQRLVDMVNDDDLCTLDSDMLILYIAGALLARSDKSDADLKIAEAEGIRRHTLGQSGSDRSQMTVFGGGSRAPALRPGVDFIVKKPGSI